MRATDSPSRAIPAPLAVMLHTPTQASRRQIERPRTSTATTGTPAGRLVRGVIYISKREREREREREDGGQPHADVPRTHAGQSASDRTSPHVHYDARHASGAAGPRRYLYQQERERERERERGGGQTSHSWLRVLDFLLCKKIPVFRQYTCASRIALRHGAHAHRRPARGQIPAKYPPT